MLFCTIVLIEVSTHSRPWAAEVGALKAVGLPNGFNTQPPVGG